MELPVTAVYDANILYPAPLRDLFLRLAHVGLVRAKWTEAIHDEWLHNLLKNNPRLAPERLTRTRELMDKAVRDCLVTDYEDLIDSLTLPDPNDRHVLAAAIRCAAAVIVTRNLADFPEEYLLGLGIEPQHPDAFLTSLIELAPSTVCTAVKEQRESLRNPSATMEELLTTLTAQGLTKAVPRPSARCAVVHVVDRVLDRFQVVVGFPSTTSTASSACSALASFNPLDCTLTSMKSCRRRTSHGQCIQGGQRVLRRRSKFSEQVGGSFAVPIVLFAGQVA